MDEENPFGDFVPSPATQSGGTTPQVKSFNVQLSTPEIPVPGSSRSQIPEAGAVSGRSTTSDKADESLLNDPTTSKNDGDHSNSEDIDLVPMQYADRENNFPPLPKWCPCQPCFYHNISVEVPPSSHGRVRLLWIFWIVTELQLVLNMIACLAVFIVDNDQGVAFGMSLLWLILFVPLSFLCWYWPLYKAFKNDSPMWFLWFFFTFSVQFLANVIAAIGIPKSGYSGFVYAIDVFSDSRVVGSICVATAAIWSALGVVAVIALIMVHRYYRGSGLNVHQAREEFKEKGIKELASN